MTSIGSRTSRLGGPGGGRALAATVAVTTSSALPVFLVGTLAVQLRHALDFDAAGLGVAVAAYYLAASVGSLPFGAAAERWDAASMLRMAAVSNGVILVALAAATRSWLGLVGVLAAAGVVASMVQPAANAFLSRKVTSARQGVAFGVKQSAVPLATLLGGLAVPSIALTVGWRWAFGAAAAVCGLSALVPPHRRGRAADGRDGTVETRATTGGEATDRPRRHPATPARSLLVLTAGFALGVAAASSFTAFLVSSAVAVGMPRGVAGLVAAVAGAVSIAGRLLAGIRADRRGRRHLRAVTVMLSFGAVGYLLLAAAAASRLAMVFVLAAALVAGVGWGWNGLFNFALVRSYPQAPAWATGVSQSGNRLGSVAGPLMFGLLAAHVSYGAAWLLCAALAAGAAVAIAAGRRLLAREQLSGARTPVVGDATR